MKKTLLIIGLLFSSFINAQILGYTDFGVLVSDENIQGTARTMAMKNTFGALGGDLSAISINPASGTVFNGSTASFSLGYGSKKIESDFYNKMTSNVADQFSLTQAGGLLVFDNDNIESAFNKVSLAVNYNLMNSFDAIWEASSPTFIGTFEDYQNVSSQKYVNATSGKQSEVNFSIATQFNEKLNIGMSFNAYNLSFTEESTREEFADDGVGNTVDSYEFYWQEVIGDGFSFGIGAIAKLTENLRLGLSYRSPIWYEIYEESNMYGEDLDDVDGYYSILYSDDPPAYENSRDKILAYDYKLRTPNRLIGSLAYVFDTKGLLSADVTYNNYKGIHLKNDFSDINQEIDEILTDSFTFSLGTEWRFSDLSARGGFSYKQNPYLNAFNSDNKRGFSLGLGYDFGGTILDLAYDYSERTDYYNFYPDFNYVDGSELARNSNKILATLSFKF